MPMLQMVRVAIALLWELISIKQPQQQRKRLQRPLKRLRPPRRRSLQMVGLVHNLTIVKATTVSVGIWFALILQAVPAPPAQCPLIAQRTTAVAELVVA